MPYDKTSQDILFFTLPIIIPQIITDQCHLKDNLSLDQGPLFALFSLFVCIHLKILVITLQNVETLCSPASVTDRKLSQKYIQNVLSCSYFA